MAESQARPQTSQYETCETQSVAETKCGFSRQTFLEVPGIKFYENPSSRNNADTCRETDGRTDRRDETKWRFSRRRKGT